MREAKDHKIREAALISRLLLTGVVTRELPLQKLKREFFKKAKVIGIPKEDAMALMKEIINDLIDEVFPRQSNQ